MFYKQFVRFKLQVCFCTNSSFFSPTKHHPINGLRAFTSHSFPNSVRKTCTTALCCFIKGRKCRTRDQNQKQHICGYLTEHYNQQNSQALTPIKPDPALGSCARRKTFEMSGTQRTTFVLSKPVLSPAQYINIALPQNSCLLCRKQEGV